MITTLGQKILIKKLEEDKLQSSIIEVVNLGESRESQHAVVVRVGSGVREDVRVGDGVITKQYCGSPVDLSPSEGAPRERFYVVMENDILGVMR